MIDRRGLDPSGSTRNAAGSSISQGVGGVMNVKVDNFKDGIVTPITDHLNSTRRQREAVESKYHKENALYFASIRDNIQRGFEKNTTSVISGLRETYYNLTRSFTSSIITTLKPVVKTFGTVLFGFGRQEKSIVKAIEEQTMFLRTGTILDSSTFVSRFLRRGVVGTLVSSTASALGVGRGAAQSAEDKRAAQQELSWREKFVTFLGVQTGMLTDIDRRDLRQNRPDSPQNQQVSMLDRVRIAVEAFMEQELFSDKLMYDQFAWIISNARRNEAMEDYRYHHQSQILNGVKQELIEANAPLMSPFEQKMLEFSGGQYEQMKLQNELAEAAAEERKREAQATGGGGGIFSLVGSIGKAIWRSGAIGGIGKMASKFIIGPLKTAIMTGGRWLAKNGFKLLLRAPFAKIFAIGMIGKLFYDHLLRPMVGWFDDTFETEIGKTLDNFTGFFADKFTGMVDWIRQKLASMPLIGRFFKGEKTDAQVADEIAKSAPKNQSEGGVMGTIKGWLGSAGDSVRNFGSSAMSGGSSVLGWYKDQWGSVFETAKQAGRSALSSASDMATDGYDYLRGYDKGAMTRIRSQELSASGIAQRAFGDVMNPAAPRGATVTEDMVIAATESKAAMYEQVEEMKRQREENRTQSQEMLNVLRSIAMGTNATAEVGAAAYKLNSEIGSEKDTTFGWGN